MKRFLALVLTLTMLLSVFAMSATAATSKSSLSNSYDHYVDVTIKASDVEKLSQYPAKELVKAMDDDYYGTIQGDIIVWSRSNDNNYTITSVEDGVMDLSNCSYMYAVIGNGKQLDYANNTKFYVSINIENLRLFDDGKVIGIDAQGESVSLTTTYFHGYASNAQTGYSMNYYPTVSEGTELYAELKLSDGITGTVTFYDGYYSSAEAAEASGRELQGVQSGNIVTLPLDEREHYARSYTAVIINDGEKTINKFYLFASADDGISISLYDGENHYITERTDTYEKNGVEYRKFYTHSYPVNAEYYLKMWKESYMTVESAFVDNGTEDIKDQLFGTKGYQANFSGTGHVFTVNLAGGETRKYAISLTGEEYMEDAGDTYFQVKSAMDEQNQRVPAYVMPYNADSLYKNSFNCYQTVLLMPNLMLDESNLRPTFAVHEGTQVYAESVGAEAAVKQISGESVVDFSNGSVEYTARDKSGSLIKNYWVDFDQKNQDAKLFVNGPVFDELQTGEVDEANKREVLLNSVSDYHDVFIANLGASGLTGLSVTLDAEAQKTLKLDDYFTVGGTGNDTLTAFTTTDGNTNQAAAKIRLRLKDSPEKLEETEIGGVMTITSDAGTKYIYLTGTILPKIITKSAPNGVKYVPYSVMIQTNNHDDSNKVTYSLTKGSLPRGVELNAATGEIYGVPKETGTFEFTVSASFSNQNLPSSEKDFNIVIEENTDQMVYSSCDDTILAWVNDMGYWQDGNETGPMELETYVDQVFEMDHEFDEFVKFFLDGEELKLGTDYYAEEGSTKVTILEKTFRDAGNGTHTIAAEFRNPGTNEMYKNAQNYTAAVSGSSSSSSGFPISNKQESSYTGGSEPGWFFDDVRTNHWFYADVLWAYNNGYMVGVSSRLFAPNNMISLPMVVTTLARMSGADLQKYAAEQYQEKYADIPVGMWFSEAAVWAKEMGLLTDEPFKVEPPLGRSDFAVILVKYLKLMGVDVDPTEKLAVFADASLMTAEENRAFQVLHYYGIFNGVGNNCMDPDGDTTRAQLAALLHRLSGLKDKV